MRRLVRGRAEASRGDVAWNPDQGQIDTAALEGVDAVVHLAGANVAQRWTPESQDTILRSRTEGTRCCARRWRGSRRGPKVLVCASAIGF